jgi:intracellular septation protein
VKFLFDFFPLILFFAAFKLADIFVATAVAIAATVAQIGWVLFRGRKVSALQWTSLAIIALFGGATLILRDETFIKWKPTVLYGLMGTAILAGLAFGKNVVKSVLAEGELDLPEPVWFKLAVAWSGFFFFMAALNLYVAYNFSTDTWATFKVFGGIGVFFVFAIATTMWALRYQPDVPSDPAEKAKG